MKLPRNDSKHQRAHQVPVGYLAGRSHRSTPCESAVMVDGEPSRGCGEAQASGAGRSGRARRWAHRAEGRPLAAVRCRGRRWRTPCWVEDFITSAYAGARPTHTQHALQAVSGSKSVGPQDSSARTTEGTASRRQSQALQSGRTTEPWAESGTSHIGVRRPSRHDRHRHATQRHPKPSNGIALKAPQSFG